MINIYNVRHLFIIWAYHIFYFGKVSKLWSVGLKNNIGPHQILLFCRCCLLVVWCEFKPILCVIHSRLKSGSKTKGQNWRKSWRTASYHQTTAPAPATPWPATLRSPPPCGTRKARPGRTHISHRTSTRWHLAFWKTPLLGIPPRPAPWIPIFKTPTRYSTHWLLERGRYIETCI